MMLNGEMNGIYKVATRRNRTNDTIVLIYLSYGTQTYILKCYMIVVLLYIMRQVMDKDKERIDTTFMTFTSSNTYALCYRVYKNIEDIHLTIVSSTMLSWCLKHIVVSIILSKPPFSITYKYNNSHK